MGRPPERAARSLTETRMGGRCQRCGSPGSPSGVPPSCAACQGPARLPGPGGADVRRHLQLRDAPAAPPGPADHPPDRAVRRSHRAAARSPAGSSGAHAPGQTTRGHGSSDELIVQDLTRYCGTALRAGPHAGRCGLRHTPGRREAPPDRRAAARWPEL